MASGWLPVRKILRAAFGPDGYQILRTGEIRVRRGDDWERLGSLTDPDMLQALRAGVNSGRIGAESDRQPAPLLSERDATGRADLPSHGRGHRFDPCTTHQKSST